MTEVISEVQRHTKIPRAEIVESLRARDGDRCQYPGCRATLDFTIADPDSPLSVTIDHHMPQWYGKENGWTHAEIWDLSNLKLMEKKCNAKKGDLIPNEDGTLPLKPQSRWVGRRHKRAGRPEFCVECNNGHNLFVGEVCANCGCNAQRFPQSAKVKFTECDHEILWCWVCSITPDMRPAAVDTAVIQGESGEWDD